MQYVAESQPAEPHDEEQHQRPIGQGGDRRGSWIEPKGPRTESQGQKGDDGHAEMSATFAPEDAIESVEAIPPGVLGGWGSFDGPDVGGDGEESAPADGAAENPDQVFGHD